MNLKLHKFGKDAEHRYDGKSFCDLLNQFSMIRHLLLWDVWLSDNQQYLDEDIKKRLPNLKGFGFTGGDNQKLSQCIIRYNLYLFIYFNN